MASAIIPVDLYNPGQVFACLGFLEAADILLGDAEGGFDWSNDAEVKFMLSAAREENPIAAVLEFLARSNPRRFAPVGYEDPPKKNRGRGSDEEAGDEVEEESLPASKSDVETSGTFPAREADRMSLPVRLGETPTIEVGHWSDGSSRNDFKLYAGNRSAYGISRAMIGGVRAKPTKRGTTGDLKSKGICQLWEEDKNRLIGDPFGFLTPMGGSFNFDPRGAWTAIDAGYSPNEHKHPIEASPVVELLAALGLQNTRPDEYETRKVRYYAWGLPLPPLLARAALGGGLNSIPLIRFRFVLDLSGKNKVVTFAEMEVVPWP